MIPKPLIHLIYWEGSEEYTHKRYISHVEHYHTLMFWCIFRYPTKMGFQDVVTIKER
jgi:hypothetical protein